MSNNCRPPALSGSSVSSAADEPSSRNHSYGSISLPSEHAPLSPLHKNPVHGIPQNIPKPPGLGHGLPSPIGSAYNSYNRPTSPNLSLTPNSSVDGNSDATGALGRGSPFPSDGGKDGNTHWNEAGTTKSQQFEAYSGHAGDPDDGLHGLGALRERSQSSPGPFAGSSGGMLSSSPPVRIDMTALHGDMSPLHSDFENSLRGQHPDNRRARLGPTGGRHTRPPLSGGGGGGSSHASFFEGSSADVSSARGRSTVSGDLSFDQPRGANVESSRPQYVDKSPAHKFGNLPSLSSHVQQQRLHMQSQMGSLHPRTGHIRSYSHSGPLQHQLDGSEDVQFGRGFDNLSHGGLPHSPMSDSDTLRGEIFAFSDHSPIRLDMYRNSNLNRSQSAGDGIQLAPRGGGLAQRSSSLAQPMPSGAMEQFGVQPSLQRRNSDQLHAGYGGQPTMHGFQQPHPMLVQRREDMGGRLSPRYDDGGPPVMATAEELRMYGIRSQSRHEGPYDRQTPVQQMQYSGSNPVIGPRFSEYNLHSSPMSAPGLERVEARMSQMQSHNPNASLQRNPVSSSSAPYGLSALDDDLTHPLAGELIDDPGDDYRHSSHHRNAVLSRHAGVGSGGFGPSVHPTRHSFSGHMERLPLSISPSYSPEPIHYPPTAGASFPMPRQIFTVKFKRTQRNFILGPRFRGDLKIGCYVKVEADRGEDLGIVVSKIPVEKFGSLGRPSYRTGPSTPPGMHSDMSGLGPSSGLGPGGIADLKRITRLATHDEVSLLSMKRQEEDDLLKICRAKVRQRGLPMHVVDAEYQFDRHKLTFFFEAEGRIDFRELVRDLFSMYKTRIWMQQLDKNGAACPTGPAPGSNSGPNAGYLSGKDDFGGSSSSFPSGAYLPQMADLAETLASTTLGNSDANTQH